MHIAEQSTKMAPSLVGEIIAGRYVVIEEVGPEAAGQRCIVYDTQGLERLTARIGAGGTAIEIIDPDAAASPASPPNPIALTPTLVDQLQPAAGAPASPPLPPLPRPPAAGPKKSMTPRAAAIPPPPPAIALAAAPEVPAPLPPPIPLEIRSIQRPRDHEGPRKGTKAPKATKSASRPSKTEMMEVAWFAQGEQLEPTEEAESATPDALEQLAEGLGPDTVNRLVLLPADPPPHPERHLTPLAQQLQLLPTAFTSLRERGRALLRRQGAWVGAICGGAALGLVSSLLVVFSTGSPAASPRKEASRVAVQSPESNRTEHLQPSRLSADHQAADTREARPKSSTIQDDRTQGTATVRARQANRRTWLHIRRNLRRAHRAYRTDRYRLARALALRVLRLDPDNRHAAGLKRRAEAKLGF